MKKTIITIGRQFGSGGRQVGKRLAERLSVPCYDKELLTESAKQAGLSPEIFESNDEKLMNSLYYAGRNMYSEYNPPINHTLFLAQFDTIRGIADAGPCVFIGRCADYALNGRVDCLNVFIYSSLENRIKTAVEEYGVETKNIKRYVLKKDKQRSKYYSFYTGKRWGDIKSYDLLIDSSKVSLDKIVDIIIKACE